MPHRNKMNSIRLAWRLLCLVCLLGSQQLAANESSVEYKIKAGYLYNFTKFVAWSEDKTPTFNICILGDDPFGELLTPLELRSVEKRAIKLFRFQTLDNLHRATHSALQCHILFVSTTIQHQLGMLNIKLSLPNQANTLLIGDNDTFAGEGGMIGFINRDDKIKLQINLTAIKQAGLNVSAKLLEVAEPFKGTDHD